MKPKFTDLHKYPHGYKKAVETNIAATFARVRKEQDANKAEAQQKVKELKRTYGRS